MPAPPAPTPLSLAALAAQCGGRIRGDDSVMIHGVAALASAQKGHLAFFAGAQTAALARTQASAILLRAADADAPELPAHTACWLVEDDPRRTFALVIDALYPPVAAEVEISPTAHIAATAQIGTQVHVGAGAVVGANAVLGDGVRVHAGAMVGAGARVGAGSVLHANVVLYPGVQVGRQCVLHAGAVLGADGFGYASGDGGSAKIRQLGSVRVGDNVEIGANSCVDCGALDDTVIEDGVKIDNLVQIGHNVVVGAHTIICGNAGIAGSSIIGKGCVIGGGAGIAGHLHIGDGARVAGASAVTRDIPAGVTVSSTLPAMPVNLWRQLVAHLRRQVKKSNPV